MAHLAGCNQRFRHAAARVGFEPTERSRRSGAFKAPALVHYATSPSAV